MVQTTHRTLDIDDMFDESAGYDDDHGVRVASGLTPEELKDAVTLYRLFNELWGICVVFGDPGTGKDLLGNYLVYHLQKYFPWKRIIRDEKPRALAGPYAALFDESLIVADLSNMTAIVKGEKESDKQAGTRLEKAAENWIKGAGEVLLKNSVCYLTEFWRYVYNREPHKPMNKTIGAIAKTKRHLDTLIIGTAQLESDLDKKTAKPYIDWKITCTRSVKNKTGFVNYVYKVKYDRRRDVLVQLGNPFTIRYDAGKPRSNMGDGKITIRKYDYKPETEEEAIVLKVIKAGLDNYEALVQYIMTHGDMSEAEILSTVKDLSFTARKHVIDYPCYFRLYNSKSAIEIPTGLKASA